MAMTAAAPASDGGHHGRQTHPTETDDDDRLPCAHARRVADGADAGGRGTAQERGHVVGRPRIDADSRPPQSTTWCVAWVPTPL